MRAGTSAFVGRVRQLGLARDVLGRLAHGHGGVIVVEGEPGVGKSRFAFEVAALARASDIEVVWAAGWPSGGAPAYWPWPDVLAAIDASAGDALDTPPGEADSERFARFRRVADVLWHRAADRPLLVVLDDIHTVDADGLLLTRFVAQGAMGHRLALVLTQRTGAGSASAAADVLDDITRSAVLCRLEAFTSDEVRTFMDARGDGADAGVVRRVCDLTGGIPFLVEQVLDADLHHRGGPIPDPVRRLTEARLRALDAVERVVVEAAAVLGPPVVLSELIDVSGTDEAAVHAACRCATASGLLRVDGAAAFSFVHELAREAVLAALPPARLAELHGRCLAVLDRSPPTAERASRRAHHAFARAAGSFADAAEAIRVARESADLLGATGSPEAAVELLADALELHERAHASSAAPLRIELGDALVATGRLRASREQFRRAVAEAAEDGDAAAFARAALGLGGVWVQEHREREEWHAYMDVLERAIDQANADPTPAAGASLANLRLRWAAEQAAVGAADPADVLAAMDTVRAVGSDRDTLAGLSLVHHVMLGPPYAGERVAIAEELVDRARACGDDLHLAMGLLWRASDELLAGREADRILVELRARADALGMHAILFAVDAIDVMRLLRMGDLDAAEGAAAACHQRGLEVGDADAETYFAAHVLAISWYRGTAAGLLDVAQGMAVSSAAPLNNPVFTAAVAALAAEARDIDTAEHALVRLGHDRLDRLLPTSAWMVTMFCLAEAAAHLDDTELAERVYEVLAPYDELPTMVGIGVCCFGSTARSLGLAARVAGRLDDAIGHLEHAIERNQRLGNRPMTAITRADLAETLLMRCHAGDRTRASKLIARAIESAVPCGLTGRIDGWVELRRRIELEAGDAAPATLERCHDAWLISAGSERARLAPSAGIDYLAALLQSPGTDIAVGELVGVQLVSTPQEVLDATALGALRARVRELESALDRAALRGDAAETARLEDELDELLAHVRASVGPAGRSRRFDDATERARTSVQKAIRRAIAAIGRECPRLADALGRSVKTGYRCRYEPADGAPEKWDVRLT